MGFSEQDFILGTVMRSYSRGLDFLELNRYVQIEVFCNTDSARNHVK